MAGLEWRDIDFEKHTISVKRARYYSKGEIFNDTPKTIKSVRTLPLQPHIIAELENYKIYQKSNMLFTTENGEMSNPERTYKFFKKFCRRHNIRFLKIHSFRHYTASVLISQGVTIPEVSEYLGHSSYLVTMSTYAHIQKKEESFCRASKIIADVLTQK